MATYSVASSKTATLVAATVDTVTLTNDYAAVEVTSLDGVAEIYVLVDSGATNPTVAGDDCTPLPAGVSSITLPSRASGNTQVKLISSGTPKYNVAGVS